MGRSWPFPIIYYDTANEQPGTVIVMKVGRTIERNGTASPPPEAKSKKQVAKDSVQVLGTPKKADSKGPENVPSNTNKKNSKNERKGRNTGGKKKNVEKKTATRKKQKSCLEQTLNNFGISFGNIVLRDPRAIEAAQALNLSPSHLRKLKVKFDRIDIDGSGNIDSDEFFEAVGEQRSPLTDRLFAMIDLDGSGTIEFDEYVRVMATYCMFTKDEILRFCFECFDVDQSGTIDEKEFVELCKIVNNAAPAFPTNFKKALEEFDVNEDGLIDYSEFLELDRRYPLILFPAFRLQDTLQRNSLGKFML